MKGLEWSPIFGDNVARLDRPFSEEGVCLAIFQLNKEQAPSPNGFTTAMYQKC